MDRSPIYLIQGVNYPDSDIRLEKNLGLYIKNIIGGLQIYACPYWDSNFSIGKIENLKMKCDEANTGIPLEFIVHAAHNAHNFFPYLGLTENNKECIDSAFDVAEILNAKYIIFHPEGIPINEGKNIKSFEPKIRIVFSYIKEKTRVYNGKVCIENMPYGDKDRTMLYSHLKYSHFKVPYYEGDFVEKLRKEFNFELCFDFTHASVSAPFHLIDLFIKLLSKKPDNCLFEQPREFYLRPTTGYVRSSDFDLIGETVDVCTQFLIPQFLKLKPKVFHVSAYRSGDLKDISHQPFSTENKKHLEIALKISKAQTPLIPIVLEYWDTKHDKKNIGMVEEVLRSHK